MNQRILRLWQNPAIGLRWTTSLELKALGIHITHKALATLLRTQPEHELFQRPPRSLGNSITETVIGSGTQADLADMSLISRRNKGFRWILTAVDIYSRRGWAVQRKTCPLVRDALKLIFKDNVPERLTTDSVTEFLNVYVQKLLKDNCVKHFTGQTLRQASVGHRGAIQSNSSGFDGTKF